MGQETPRKSRPIDHLTTVDDVEQRSGWNFFWLLPAPKEDAMEAVKDPAGAQS